MNEMVGNWASVELKEAMRLGYEVLEVYEMIVWDEKSNTQFRDFLEFGYKGKTYSANSKEDVDEEFIKENAESLIIMIHL